MDFWHFINQLLFNSQEISLVAVEEIIEIYATKIGNDLTFNKKAATLSCTTLQRGCLEKRITES